MTEPPLVIPFLPDVGVGGGAGGQAKIDLGEQSGSGDAGVSRTSSGPSSPTATASGALPTRPRRVAAWTASTSSGPSRRIALAGEDNTLWIVTSRAGPTSQLAPPLSLAIPGSSSGTAFPGAHAGGLKGSAASSPSKSMRPRATSNASSAISTSSRAGKRMFSPTASTVALTSPPALTALAAPAPESGHHRTPSDRALDSLKNYTEDERGGLGLGLAGLTRRGLNVHSKEDIEASNNSASASSPKDTTPSASGSLSSEGTAQPRARTLSRLSGFWKNSEQEEAAAAAATKAKMDEIDVEREMAREAAEDAKEETDFQAVKRAKASTPVNPSTPEEHDEGSKEKEGVAPLRIVLPVPARGKIVHLAVFEEIGQLVALRDVGLLDVISLNDLALTQHIDLDAASTTKERRMLPPAWAWRRVHLAAREEGTLLVANGIPWPTAGPSPNGEVTRVVMLALPTHECVATLELPGIGDVGVASSGEASYLLHSTPTSLMSYHIIFPNSAPPSRTNTPNPPKSPSPMSPKSPTSPAATPLISLSRPPVRSVSMPPPKSESSLSKFLHTRRIASRKAEVVVEMPQPGVDGGVECLRDGGGHWPAIRLHDNGHGIGIGDGHVEAFEFDGVKLTVRGSISVPGTIKDVSFTPGWHDVCIVTDTEAHVLSRDGRLKSTGQTWNERKTYPAHAASIVTGSLYAVEDKSVTNVDLGTLERRVEASLQSPVAGEHICPLGADIIFAADERGNVRKQTLADYLHHAKSQAMIAADRLDSPVTCSAIVASDLAVGGQFLLMGDADGAVRIWDARPLHLRGSWTLFDDAVRSVTPLNMSEVEILHECVLLTSSRGSVAVISLKEMDELFLLPAARDPLIRIFIGGKDIMLAYENGKARVWNVETREFRRSTGFDSAEDMLSAGKWAEVPFRSPAPVDCPVSKAVGPTPLGCDLGRLLQLDLRQLGRWLHSETESPLAALRGLLSVFLTFGINPAIDETCTSALGITPPAGPAAVGLEGPNRTVELALTSPSAAWRVSPTVTGLRQLAIVSLLRPFLDSPDHESAAADVIAYYTACLPDDALEADLELFAAFYLDSATDVHQAARMLFAARLSRIPNEKIEELVAEQQGHLPTAVPKEQSMGEPAARALTMVGGMALHRFECMNPAALKTVAESISLYLHDPNATHVALAIELCSKGFSTWQAYLDPMNLLRRLFYLATHKDASGANTAAIARLAVLHVASNNAPLFMTTLSMDILDAKSVEGRTSIMKLCVFMARKRPALLENGLPRICEAVVKSLDPNAGKMRDDVWEAATVILNELVQAFTTIDFNPSTQRLSVGTNEGAVIMYDLKSASRLYVLEAHKAAVSAVAFSPDGRRLVTVSLLDSNVTVWKVGSSISAFFNVGGPPRQGAAPGEPYKRIPFVRPNRDPNEDVGALSDAQIAWRGNRQALVTIKETALNFETT